MKKVILLFLFCLVSLVSFEAYCQSPSYTNLGTLCYININLRQTPVDSQGYYTFTIHTPQERICGVQGPGSPILINNLGSTVDLQIRRMYIELAADGNNCEIPLEAYVEKWSTGWGNYTTSPTSGSAQCYYYIVLLVEQ